MKAMKLLAFSIFILCLALLFQSELDRDDAPNASPLVKVGVRDAEQTKLASPAVEPSVRKVHAVQPAHVPRQVREQTYSTEAVDLTQQLLRTPRRDLEVVRSTPVSVSKPAKVANVAPTPTQTMPLVKTFQPTTNAMLEDLHTQLTFTFDREWTSVQPTLIITPTAEGEISWHDDFTMVFTPFLGWVPNTRYEIRLGDGFHTWFRTARVISSVFPSRGDAISPRTKFAVQFGVKIDRASVERAFRISPAIKGRMHWTDEARFVFEPDEALDYVTTYRVGFEGGLLDYNGRPLPQVSTRTFTTRSALVSANPQGTVNVDSPIVIEFDTPMDTASVESAVAITAAVGDTPQAKVDAGSFHWQGNTMVFTPDGHWDPNTTYYVTLNSAVRDADGRSVLTEDYGWGFATAALPRTVDFGYGPNVQVLNAAGRRAVQLTSFVDGEGPGELRLYALNEAQFLDLYSSSFRGIGPGEEKPMDTDGLPLITNWEQDLQRLTEVFIPADVAPGLYILEAQLGPGTDQLIVIVTHHTLVIKQAGRQLVTWASTMADHAAASGMRLRFYDRDGMLVAEGVTEGRGLHRTTVPVETEPLLVIGELHGDVTVGGLGNEWQQGWGWWGWWSEDPSTPLATIYAYTDRPIYRPGQTVHARAVVRRDEDAVFTLPDGVDVVLRLRDARDNVIATRVRTPDEFGAIYTDFEIADGGTVGTYNLEVSALGETARQPFLVEAYRKPDFEVTLQPSSEHVVSGEPLSLTVQADYFFGQPVANARVELVPYVVHDYGWYGGAPALDYGFPHEKLRQVGQTDAKGRFSVLLPAELTNDAEHQIWNVEATVTDASELSVSGHARVLVHRAAFGLELHTEKHHFRPGEGIPVTMVARDHDDTPQAGATLRVGLYAWHAGTSEFSRVVAEAEALTGAAGEVQAVLQNPQAGWFQVRAKGADGAGRPVEAKTWVWVYEGDSVWDAATGGELRLSTDRDSYVPGESVRLLIESPVSGPALLSFERGTTRRETVVQLNDGLTTLDFQLLPDDIPNIHVAIAVWRPTQESEQWRWQSRPDEELLTARTEILVPADDQRLTVTITPDQDQYAPRQNARFLVEMRNAAGQPVRAGFSLALVDEAIFTLAADKTPHIFDAFYQPRPDIVRTYHSLRPMRWLDGGRGGGGGGEAPPGSPRSDFPDTAFWAPALTTDAEGKAWVEVVLPDSLTSWRAVVRAVTPDTKVGQADAKVTVALPLSIQPVLPRFLVRGDEATLTAVVHNHTGVTHTATVQLTAAALELAPSTSAVQPITLPANGTVAVGWSVAAAKSGPASVRMDVALPAGQEGEPWHDAVVLPLPVEHRAVPELTTVSAEVKGAWADTIELPERAIADLSRWELSLAPTIANGVLEGLEYLIDYPFG